MALMNAVILAAFSPICLCIARILSAD